VTIIVHLSNGVSGSCNLLYCNQLVLFCFGKGSDPWRYTRGFDLGVPPLGRLTTELIFAALSRQAHSAASINPGKP
jgi:hypothetical protein